MLSHRESHRELVESLRESVRRWEGGERVEAARIGSGCAALDRLLPGGGFRRGALVEWLGAPGAGATTLALLAAREACREGGALLVVDPQRRFYPPAAAALDIDLENLVVACPAKRDYGWTLTQALGCSAVAAVLAWPGRLDDRTFRRWQLAAEKTGALGLLVRPLYVRGDPSWAEVQLLVRPRSLSSRHLHVELLRSRAGSGIGGRVGARIQHSGFREDEEVVVTGS